MNWRNPHTPEGLHNSQLGASTPSLLADQRTGIREDTLSVSILPGKLTQDLSCDASHSPTELQVNGRDS